MGDERTPPWAVRTIVGTFGVAAIVALAVVAYPSIPGTFHRDQNGLPYGTGRELYRYPSGQLKLAEDYQRGRLTRSEWYRPDGTTVATTQWIDGHGVGYMLREDGSIRNRKTFVSGLAEGPATYYDEAGNVIGEAVFKGGKRVSGYEPPPAH